MTVEQAVLGLIISYRERGIKRVPVWEVEQAHDRHRLSGRARIRGLRQRGYVDYRYCGDDNTYEILSSLPELYEAWTRLTGKRIARAQSVAMVHSSTERRQDISDPVLPPEEEKIDIEEIRRFRESL